jgi:hypothetical protein
VCAYVNTLNKATIRRGWDLPILEHWSTKMGRPLTYFGLPGPEIHDLIDWRHVLGVRTGVESPGRNKKERAIADEAIGRMNANTMFNGLSSGFQVLKADIEDVILNCVDNYGNPPQLNDGNPAHLAHFRYDVVNLDFDGGLGYSTKNGARRVYALKKLFERQEGHSFILFLTVNVRDTLGEEVEDYLQGLQRRDRGPGWYEIIDWYLNRAKGEREYKLKATVPSFIHAISESRVFQCRSRPPIAYTGHERARMIHFVFELETVLVNRHKASLRGFSLQDDRDLIELPLLKSENGQLKIAAIQHPGFDFTNCKTIVNFLPKQTGNSLITLPYEGSIVEAKK